MRILDEYSPQIEQGGRTVSKRPGAAIYHEFVATSSTTTVTLDGSSASFSNTDPILNAVTLERTGADSADTAGVVFAAGETYDIRVVVESSQMAVYVDDVSVGSASSGGTTDFASEVSIYVGDPWYNAARVTLSHICLKEVGVPSSAPTVYAPTMVPTTALPTTARPTMLDLMLSDTLTASDAEPGDYFGYSVAISGDTVVAGAPYDSNTGSAYIFRMTDGGAASVEVAKLKAADAVAGDFFGRSVAIDANTVVVGAWYQNSRRGAAYVFRTPDGGATYGQVANLTASDAAGGRQLRLFRGDRRQYPRSRGPGSQR